MALALGEEPLTQELHPLLEGKPTHQGEKIRTLGEKTRTLGEKPLTLGGKPLPLEEKPQTPGEKTLLTRGGTP